MALEPKPIDRLSEFISGSLDPRSDLEEGTVWFVGGSVRDALLDREPREIDLLTSGSATALARDIGEIVEEHERFGTVKVRVGHRVFDIAQARTEKYPVPGALPIVTLGVSVEQDLARRDFTINAIAMTPSGALVEYPGALSDLEEGVLKALHDKSFTDDATRLWRLARYSTRLGFKVAEHTSELAAAAVAAGAHYTVSRDRIGAELRLTLIEPDPLAALHAAQNLRLIPKLEIDPSEVGEALEILPAGGRSDLLILAAVLPDDEWVADLGFTAEELATIRKCIAAPGAPSGAASQVASVLRDLPDEAVALAGARGNREAAERWLLELRHVALEITGDDLIAAGIKKGPEIGERLRRTLDRKLDGELLSGRDEELAAALG